jgi:hypothetical protein
MKNFVLRHDLCPSAPVNTLPCTHIFLYGKMEHSLSRKAGDNTD